MGGSSMLDMNTMSTALRLGSSLVRTTDRAGRAGDQAAAAEIEAAAGAADERRRGADRAEEIARRNRRDKAGRMAGFGRSGLLMAGSPLLVAAAEAKDDEDQAREALDQGRQRAQDTLARGRARAAGLRSTSPSGSLLDLGGSLWDRLY